MPSRTTFHYITAQRLADSFRKQTLEALLLKPEEARSLREASDVAQTPDAVVHNARILADGGDVPGATELEVTVADRLRSAVLYGEGRVDSAVGMRYDIPAVAADGTVPIEVESSALVMARHALVSTNAHLESVPGLKESVEAETKWLDQVSRGQKKIILLSSDEGAEPVRSATPKVGTVRPAGSRFTSSMPWF